VFDSLSSFEDNLQMVFTERILIVIKTIGIQVLFFSLFACRDAKNESEDSLLNQEETEILSELMGVRGFFFPEQDFVGAGFARAMERAIQLTAQRRGIDEESVKETITKFQEKQGAMGSGNSFAEEVFRCLLADDRDGVSEALSQCFRRPGFLKAESQLRYILETDENRMIFGLSLLNTGESKLALSQFELLRSKVDRSKTPEQWADLTLAISQAVESAKISDKVIGDCAKMLEIYREIDEDSPLTQAAMYLLSRFHFKREDYQKAGRIGEQLLEIRLRDFSESHPYVVTALKQLGEISLQQKKYEAAIDYFQRAMTGAEAKSESETDVARLVFVRQRLAYASLNAGEVDEAVQLERETQRICLKRFGEDDTRTLNSQSDYGVYLMRAKQFSEAEEVLRENGRMISKKFGPTHWRTLKNSDRYVDVMMAMGKWEQARSITDYLIKYRKKTLGKYHRDTLLSISKLGSIYQKLGDREKALMYHEAALAGRTKAFGEDHPHTVFSRRTIATIHGETDSVEEQLRRAHEELELLSNDLGEHHPNTRAAIAHVVQLLIDSGQLAKAEKLAIQMLRVKESPRGHEIMAQVLQASRRYDDAQKHLNAAYQMRVETEGANHLNTLENRSILGTMLMYANRVDEALPIHIDVLEKRRERLPEGHQDIAAAANNLGFCFLGMQRYEQALPLLQEAMKGLTSHYGGEHIHVLYVQNNLGRVFEGLEEFEKALPLYLASLKGRQRVFGPEEPKSLGVMNRLVGLYLKMEQYDKAVSLGRQTLQLAAKVSGGLSLSALEVTEKVAYGLHAVGDSEDGVALMKKTLSRLQASVGSDNQLFRSFRSRVDSFLALVDGE